MFVNQLHSSLRSEPNNNKLSVIKSFIYMYIKHIREYKKKNVYVCQLFFDIRKMNCCDVFF